MIGLTKKFKELQFITSLLISAQEDSKLNVPTILIGNGETDVKKEIHDRYMEKLRDIVKKTESDYKSLSDNYSRMFDEFLKSYKEKLNSNAKMSKEHNKELDGYTPTTSFNISVKPYVLDLKAKTDAHKMAINDLIRQYFIPKLAVITNQVEAKSFDGDWKDILMASVSRSGKLPDDEFKTVEIPPKMVSEYLSGFGINNLTMLQDQHQQIEAFTKRLRENIEGAINKLKIDVDNFDVKKAQAESAEIEGRAKKITRLLCLFKDLRDSVSVSNTITMDRLATGEQIVKAVLNLKEPEE